MDMINIGYSGASTAQVELNVTAQNTANAMTTGYTRQVAEISTIGASGGSPNSAGNGVQVDSIRRVSNQYQVNQVWYAASDYGYYSTQQGYLSQLEAVLSDDNSSLSGGFDNFFAALNEATTSPDDSALREQVISEAGALSLRIDNTLDYIDSQSTEIISQQQAMVSQINTLTSGIASYNQQIAQAEGSGDSAAGRYGARGQMGEELSGMMDVQVNIDDQGNYNVTLKNGQPLVSGQQSSTIALETNADGTPTMSLTFAGTTSTMTTDTGGSLGALFDYQNDVLTPDITADELAFSSSPDESGNSDNLQALINISTEPLEIANLGSVTVGQACSSIISNIGIYSQQNQTEVDAASNVYSAAQNQQSSVSGVSMDEEAVNLITYQQIYEANLKVISAGAEIFDSVLEMCS